MVLTFKYITILPGGERWGGLRENSRQETLLS